MNLDEQSADTAKQNLDVVEVELQLRSSQSEWVTEHLSMMDRVDWSGKEDLRQRALLEIYGEWLWSKEKHKP